MKKIIVPILLMITSLSFAGSDQPSVEEIQFNYAVTCGSFTDIEAAMNEKLTNKQKTEAIENRKMTLDILANGQKALDKQGPYSSMACIPITVARDLIILSGCLNLETGEKIVASTDSAAGLAVCKALVDSGDAMPGF